MDYLAKINEGKMLENQSDWGGAPRVWLSLGMKEDADACLMIHNAILKGDRFRARVDELLNTPGDWGTITPALIYDAILRKAMEEIYDIHS